MMAKFNLKAPTAPPLSLTPDVVCKLLQLADLLCRGLSSSQLYNPVTVAADHHKPSSRQGSRGGAFAPSAVFTDATIGTTSVISVAKHEHWWPEEQPITIADVSAILQEVIISVVSIRKAGMRSNYTHGTYNTRSVNCGHGLRYPTPRVDNLVHDTSPRPICASNGPTHVFL